MNEDPLPRGLEPALELSSYVAAVKPLAPGESAGYGRRFIAERETWIATMPIGYADGVAAALTNNCEVLIEAAATRRRDRRAWTTSPWTSAPDRGGGDRRRGDPDRALGDERQTVEDVANRLGTIDHEILCGISGRVPRRYHRDGVDEP